MDFKKLYKKIITSKSKYVVLLGIVGILLIGFSAITTKKKDKLKKEEQNKLCFNTTDNYVENLEKKLKNIISKIKGVGSCEIFITLENGVENVYANSEKKAINSNENFSGKMSKRNDIQKDVVVIDGNKGKQALMITQKEPTIKGVLVVCDGADDMSVVEQVNDAVSKCLNIKKNRLSVVKSAKKN